MIRHLIIELLVATTINSSQGAYDWKLNGFFLVHIQPISVIGTPQQQSGIVNVIQVIQIQ